MIKKKKKPEKITREFLIKEIKHLEPGIEEGSDNFNTALMLLASVVVGANQRKIASFTKLPISFISPRAKRLRENQVWQGGKVACEWFEKDGGSIAFWCDALVAEGLVKRSWKEKANEEKSQM